MSKVVIVGAGVAGLGLAKQLSSSLVEISGLEKDLRGGGRFEIGHQRVYTAEARDFMTDLLPDTAWSLVEEPPFALRKGEFGPLGDMEFSAPESFYLATPFWQPAATYHSIVEKLWSQVGESFRLRTQVASVDLANKSLLLVSGEKVAYDKLLWTSTLASLGKATGETPKGIAKKKPPVIETGGITLDLDTSASLFAQANTVVIPFRYKDHKLKGLGMQAPWSGTAGAHSYRFLVFLEDALLEDREELAKVVRAFKRELTRTFPDLEKAESRERIVFHPSLSGEIPVSVRSLEIYPDVVCVGSDLYTEEVSPDKQEFALRNLDLTLRNCLDFLDITAPQWQLKTQQPVLASTAPLEALQPE
ncbi:hypothetical protein K2X33_16325 [bacterium]|nr:hypothetical protein [bacterium]